jgi:U2 small nuclear ribonucleoprotein A'
MCNVEGGCRKSSSGGCPGPPLADTGSCSCFSLSPSIPKKTNEKKKKSQNQFDTIDLSDNAIARLDGFPRLPRARTLLAHGNRVSVIGSGLGAALPALTTLGLAGNRLARLADLGPLAACPRLAHLVLTGCPVARHPSYRAYVAWKCRGLRSLDGRRVSGADRAAADEAYGGDAGAAAAASAAATVVAPAKTFEPGEGRPEVEGGGEAAGTAGAAAAPPAPPTGAQLAAVRAAIEGAATLEEVAALEAALAAGDGAAAAELAAKDGMDEG